MPREGNHTYQGGERQTVAEYPTTLRSGHAVADGPTPTRLDAVLTQLRGIEDSLLGLGSDQAKQLHRLTGAEWGFPEGVAPAPDVEPVLEEIGRRLSTIRYLADRSRDMSGELGNI